MSDTPDTDAGFLTVDEFCEKFRIGVSSFYEELNGKRIEARKVRGRTLIEKAEAARWAKACPKWTPKSERAA